MYGAVNGQNGGFMSAMPHIDPFALNNPGMFTGAMARPAMAAPVMGATAVNPMSSMKSLEGFTPSLGAGANPGWMGIQGLGANVDTLKLGVGALQGFAGLWNGFQQNKLAKASFNHQKGILDTNMANSIKAYNLSIDDKFRSRAVVEGMSNADRDAAIERNKARDERRG